MAPRGHDMQTLTCILGRKPGGAGVVVIVVVVVIVAVVILVKIHDQK